MLIEDAASHLPEGVDKQSVQLKSDLLTSKTNSYIPTYKKNIGGTEMDFPIIDTITGKPVRWSPDIKKYVDSKNKMYKEEIDRKISEATKLNEIYRTKGNPNIDESKFSELP